jgi:hypothetical protein
VLTGGKSVVGGPPRKSVAELRAGMSSMSYVTDRDVARLCTRDKVVIGLILAYTSIALSLELYWLIFNQVMETRTDLFAQILSLYWPADYGWRIPGNAPQKAVSLALETVNVFITPWLSLGLIWAIVKRRPYRFPLQLVIGTYTSYGTLVYFLIAHFSDYAGFDVKGVYEFALFHLANSPWLVGYGWFAWDAFRNIVSRLQV